MSDGRDWKCREEMMIFGWNSSYLQIFGNVKVVKKQGDTGPCAKSNAGPHFSHTNPSTFSLRQGLSVAKWEWSSQEGWGVKAGWRFFFNRGGQFIKEWVILMVWFLQEWMLWRGLHRCAKQPQTWGRTKRTEQGWRALFPLQSLLTSQPFFLWLLFVRLPEWAQCIGHPIKFKF